MLLFVGTGQVVIFSTETIVALRDHPDFNFLVGQIGKNAGI